MQKGLYKKARGVFLCAAKLRILLAQPSFVCAFFSLLRRTTHPCAKEEERELCPLSSSSCKIIAGRNKGEARKLFCNKQKKESFFKKV